MPGLPCSPPSARASPLTAWSFQPPRKPRLSRVLLKTLPKLARAWGGGEHRRDMGDLPQECCTPIGTLASLAPRTVTHDHSSLLSSWNQ